MNASILGRLGSAGLLSFLLVVPVLAKPEPVINEIALPAAFDLRELDAVTPIKQQAGGTCWTHGTVAAIESHLLLTGFWKANGRSGLPALSEYHLDWWNGFNKHFNEDVADPSKDSTGLRVHFGGDYRVATAYLSQGGIVVLPCGRDVYRDSEWYAKAPPRSDCEYHRLYVRDVEWFTMGDNLEGIELIKRRIMTDGAIGTCYQAGRTYLGKDNVQYQPLSTKGDPNHAVAIVGWDDAKLSTDAEKKAPKPGAWLIKNSWGQRRGDQGYFWISYYDKHCCRHPEMGAVSFRNVEPSIYTDIYSHDLHGWRDTLKDVSKAFNSFTASGRQMLRAVSFYTTQHDVKYTASIYGQFENGQLTALKATKSGTIPYCGFHTINLDSPILIQPNEKFHVFVEVSQGGHAIDRTSIIPVLLEQPPPEPKSKDQPRGKGQRPPQSPPWVTSKANPGESFFHDGTGWKDLYKYRFADGKFDRTANFCIKALAVATEESPNRKFAAMLEQLPVRSIGPANMSGRVTDIAVVESNPSTFYIGAATGGVWKTTDAGTSWSPIFDQQDTLGIGAVAVAPSNPDVIYVGTGEANPRNSATWGRGIYRSTDAGKSWTFSGLPDSHHIGRIVVHPTKPDVAYAAVMGHLWGPNRERGLFKTIDGGKTWNNTKFIDENTGFIDVAIDPLEPETLYAAAYPARRDGFSGGAPKTQWSATGGLYKTSDGGKSWAKLKGGLPDRPMGRCGVSIHRNDPKIVYAVVQTDKTDGPTDNRGQVAKSNEGDVEKGGIFRSDDKGETWKKVNDLVPRPFYYGQIRVDPRNDQQVYVLGVAFSVSSDGGKTFTAPRINTHGDHHALWINPQDSNHLIVGNDGGVYSSKDSGKNWTAHRGMAIGQVYNLAVDMRSPYWVYCGLQDNGSWHGPTATNRAEGVTLSDWKRHDGGDGFQTLIDPADPNIIYPQQQYGRPSRVDLKAEKGAKGKRIQPTAGKDKPPYRFNWNTPFVMSHHEPKSMFIGGNMVFETADRGQNWKAISPDLTRAGPDEKSTNAHTISAIAESPLKSGILFVGTDDGNVHITRDGGRSWTDVSENIPGVPADRWINKIECSHFSEGTAYLAISRHRNDDFRSYLFRTTNFGVTWERVTYDLPYDSPIHVVRESSRNKNLLFVGTEHGLFASIDGGQRWHRIKYGLPPSVPVHDLVIHPRNRELVIGTHGRSIYVMDIGPLEELTDQALSAKAHLFEIRPRIINGTQQTKETSKTVAFSAPNPPAGTAIYYYLKENGLSSATILVTDKSGQSVATLTGPANKGLNRVYWTNGVTPLQGEFNVMVKIGNQEVRRPLTIGAAVSATDTEK